MSIHLRLLAPGSAAPAGAPSSAPISAGRSGDVGPSLHNGR
ncbi:MAG: hypothetical protein VX460_06640 [Planctomycetota bacterium]|nr:hypothetical protein [Planctomycetota bacterium]